MANMAAARKAEKELGAEIRVITKASQEYAKEKEAPPCPSVAVNGTLIVMNDIVTYESLRSRY